MTAVAAIDADMRRMTRASAACRRLMLTALAFVAAIDDPSRIRRSRDVGAYLGLVPRRYQSGEVDYVGSISKCGDRRVRTLLYEAANVMQGERRLWLTYCRSSVCRCEGDLPGGRGDARGNFWHYQWLYVLTYSAKSAASEPIDDRLEIGGVLVWQHFAAVFQRIVWVDAQSLPPFRARLVKTSQLAVASGQQHAGDVGLGKRKILRFRTETASS